MREERGKKTTKKKKKPNRCSSVLSLLSFLLSHSLPSNHLALKHYISVYRCLCFLRPPSLPSWLLSSTILAWTLAHSLQPLHLMYYWRTQQAAKGGRKEERKEGREKILVVQEHVGLSPPSCDTGGVCVGGVCVDVYRRVCSLSTPETPKLIHTTFFESFTFVNWYRHDELTRIFCHCCFLLTC